MLTLSGCKNIMIISECTLVQYWTTKHVRKISFLLLLKLIKTFPIGKYRKISENIGKCQKISENIVKGQNAVQPLGNHQTVFCGHALNTVSLKILESICMSEIKPTVYVLSTYNTVTGSRSTFEFPSRVNLSGPSLYCT